MAGGRGIEPAYLTGCLLRAANRDVPPCLSQIVLLDVALLRLRRPIRDNPSGYFRFAALATKPGEKRALIDSSGDRCYDPLPLFEGRSLAF